MANKSSMASIAGGVETGLTAAGSTQGTALALPGGHNVIGTAAASTGVILPAGGATGMLGSVANAGANSVTIYPPVGGKLNGAAANAGLALAATKCALFMPLENGLDYNVVIGA